MFLTLNCLRLRQRWSTKLRGADGPKPRPSGDSRGPTLEKKERSQSGPKAAKRKAKGEELLKEIKEEDEDAAPVEPEKTKPEDDAYLTESGRILLDYLGLEATLAKH